MRTVSELLDYAGALRTEATLAAAELGAGTSACALAKSGQSFPAYKFHEGRAAAMSQLQRHLRDNDADPADVVAALVADWNREAELRAAQSRDWQAYAAGGQDAAGSVASWLAG